jgi:cytochrome c oxidase assembly protein subunit 15
MSLTTQPYQRHYDRQIAAWLILCAAVIFGMILLGGVTRLTESGLSMVEWRPLMGIVPPLNEAQWMEVFNKYRQFPEYQKVKTFSTFLCTSICTGCWVASSVCCFSSP